MLTYEQWRKTINVNVDETIEQCLKDFHGIDASTEIESALRKEYDEYVKECK